MTVTRNRDEAIRSECHLNDIGDYLCSGSHLTMLIRDDDTDLSAACQRVTVERLHSLTGKWISDTGRSLITLDISCCTANAILRYIDTLDIRNFLQEAGLYNKVCKFPKDADDVTSRLRSVTQVIRDKFSDIGL